METKKFKINTKELEKGGKKLTKSSILSKIGFTIAGAVIGAAAGMATGQRYQVSDNPQKPEEDSNDEVHTVEEEEEVQQSPDQHHQNSDDDITEPQPTDTNHSNSSSGNSTEDVVNPDDVAQALANEIDPDDIDSENILTPVGYDYAYLEDGRQVFCIIAHDPDGNEYALADLDGDGYLGDILDMNGNLVAQLDERLSFSDILDMMDDSGEYIASIIEPWEEADDSILGEEPDDDLAQAEEIGEDDILAQLNEENAEEPESEVYTESDDEYVIEDGIEEDENYTATT